MYSTGDLWVPRPNTVPIPTGTVPVKGMGLHYLQVLVGISGYWWVWPLPCGCALPSLDDQEQQHHTTFNTTFNTMPPSSQTHHHGDADSEGQAGGKRNLRSGASTSQVCR